MTSKERASSLIDSFCPHAGTGSTRLASNCFLCIESAIEDAECEATEREKARAAKMAEAVAACCDKNGKDHFCELFGCQSFVELASAIRGEKTK